MQKSKIDVAEFKRRWYNAEDIDPDSIEDDTLKSMYVELIAMYIDSDELVEKLERYIDAHTGHRQTIHGESVENADQQSNGSRYRLLDSGPH